MEKAFDQAEDPPPYALWRPSSFSTPAQKAKQDQLDHALKVQEELFAFKQNAWQEPSTTAARDKREEERLIIERVKRSSALHPSKNRALWSVSDLEKEPSGQEILSIISQNFPPRMYLPVVICDVYRENATVTIARVGEIERTWKWKPPGCLVRWIHAPLGEGVLQSSIEDMFCHDRPAGRPFRHAGSHGTPFLDLDLIHFRSREELEHLYKLHELMKRPDLRTAFTKSSCLNGNANHTLQEDIEWRLRHLERPLDFRDWALDDLPLELSELSSRAERTPRRAVPYSEGLLDSPAFEYGNDGPLDAHPVWAPFRSFHRNDGMLLTMSSATGVDALNRDFQRQLQKPALDRMMNPEHSTYGKMLQILREQGAQHWDELTVESLVVHLFTEIGMTPYNLENPQSRSNLLAVLRSQLRQLRYEKLKLASSPSLLKSYIITVDALRTLNRLYKRRISFFTDLSLDLQEGDVKQLKKSELQTSWNSPQMTSIQRVEKALKINESENDTVEELLKDTLNDLNAVSQLQHSAHAERERKTFIVFTVTTIVFLPLSITSAFFAMDSKANIGASSKTQLQIWKVAGLTMLVLILTGVLFLTGQGSNNLLRRLSRPNILNASPRMTERGIQRLCGADCQQGQTSGSSTIRNNIGYSFLKKNLSRAVTATLWMLGMEISESIVPTGHVRIRWRCSCGKNLHDDFVELEHGAARSLQSRLKGDLPRTLSAFASALSSSTAPSDSQSLSSSLSTAPTLVVNPSGSCSETSEQFLTNSSLESQDGLVGNICVFPRSRTLYLLTCIRERRHANKLSQIPLHRSDIRSDTDLALALRRHYKHVNRQWYRRLRLRGLVSIEFVQFTLHRNRLVDIRKTPDVPGDDGTHDYDFVRNKLLPPIGSSYLVHLFHNPHEYDEELIAFESIPKKLSPLQGGIGWGIQLTEGFLPERLWIFIIAALTTFAMVFALVWSVKEHDMQAGFGVAGFVTALISMFFGLLQVCLG